MGEQFSKSGAKDAATVKSALAKGKAVEPSIACPLILEEIYRDMASGVNNFVICESGSREIQDAKMAMYYSATTQDMIKTLPFVSKVPCNLSVLNSMMPSKPGVLKDRLTNDIWQSVKNTIMPSLTIVLGAPCSGTEILAPMLASRASNSYAVDVDQLLDKELERKTEAGVMMHNVLA